MKLQLNKQYLTRNGLTITVLNDLANPRDVYRFECRYENGPSKGDVDFWTEEGAFLVSNGHENDLMSEL